MSRRGLSAEDLADEPEDGKHGKEPREDTSPAAPAGAGILECVKVV